MFCKLERVRESGTDLFFLARPSPQCPGATPSTMLGPDTRLCAFGFDRGRAGSVEVGLHGPPDFQIGPGPVKYFRSFFGYGLQYGRMFEKI